MKNGMNILLVEDNDIDAEILARGLKRLDISCSIIRANDGVDALEILARDKISPILPKPYVILLDINMPRMDGHEFLAEVRQAEDLTNASVFVFTTSNNPRDVELAYKNAASGYIVKPNTSSELAGVLHALENFWDLCEYPTHASL